MNAERKMLIDLADLLRSSMCRCMPLEPGVAPNTGALVCGKPTCPRQNKPALERIFQLLGDGDAAAGASIVDAEKVTEDLDTYGAPNGERLREIVLAEAPDWHRGNR